MNPLNYLVRHRDFALIVIANLALVIATVSSAYHNSPLLDEPAHFTSGVVLAQYSDAGYFRVNGPLNKWLTAVASVAFECKLPPLTHSSNYSSAARPEFDTGDRVLELNRDRYAHFLFIARLVRIPMLLLGSWMLWQSTLGWVPPRRMLCIALWCTSPLVLGHGSVVSADAPSGVAMCLILWLTVRLWHHPSLVGFALSGMAWGLAIGTKFTFGPLYLAYPLLVHLSATKGWTLAMAGNNSESASYKHFWLVAIPTRNWIVHALIACLTLNCLYFFHEVGVPIEKHHFISHAFSAITQATKEESSAFLGSGKRVLGWIPSPFPKSFLEGVDQQLADMDSPRGAYLLGSRIAGEIHWFHLVGYLMKEQLAVWVAGLLLMVASLLGWLRRTPRAEKKSDDPLVTFSVLFLLFFTLFMATQCNLVWNIRYLILGLPLVYVSVAALLPSVLSLSPRTSRTGSSDPFVYGLIAVMALEFATNYPYHFSYINPIFGGSHRVPIALNDSNFDYGQDLFRIRDWLSQRAQQHAYGNDQKIHGVLSGHGRLWLGDLITPATDEVVRKALVQKELETGAWRIRKLDDRSRSDILIVSRGLSHPEPWAVRYSTLGDDRTLSTDLLTKLLRHPPDMSITPVIAVYLLEH